MRNRLSLSLEILSSENWKLEKRRKHSEERKRKEKEQRQRQRQRAHASGEEGRAKREGRTEICQEEEEEEEERGEGEAVEEVSSHPQQSKVSKHFVLKRETKKKTKKKKHGRDTSAFRLVSSLFNINNKSVAKWGADL